MDKIDMRKLGYEGLRTLRDQVIRHKKKGLQGKEIAGLMGISESQVSRIWSSYRKGGVTAITPKVRGRKTGEQTLLSKEKEAEIRKIIIDRTPDQLKMSFLLWTRTAISQLIHSKYGIVMSERCVTNYLQRWGFSCQRPTKRAYCQDNVKVDRFMKEEYPAIAQRAKEEKAEIYWGDETGIDNQQNRQRGFAPKGQPPVLKVETRPERVNMMAAINNYGKVRFMFYEANMNQQRLMEFMRRMIRDVSRKVYLILDNLKVHHGKMVRHWLEKNKDRIEVFYLPSYSPELNPDEYLNQALKQDVHKGINPRTKADIRHKSQSFMRRMQRKPNRIKAFFRHPKLAYINCDI